MNLSFLVSSTTSPCHKTLSTIINPFLYKMITSILIRILSFFGRRKGSFSYLPFATGWTSVRDFPSPEGKSFLSQWKGDHDDGV